MSYELYIAKVTGTNATDSNGEIDGRIQCRILPQMSDTTAIPSTSCPSYPYFFKDQLLIAESDDLVWVLASEDFSVGYVLGMANYNAYIDENATFTSNYKDSTSGKTAKLSVAKTLLDKISSTVVELEAHKLSFKDIKVDYWNEKSIHFTERSTGGKIIAFSNGTIYIMRPKEFAVKIGDSVIQLTKEGIALKSEKISLDSENVGLGKNATYKVLVSSGSSGETAIASESIKA